VENIAKAIANAGQVASGLDGIADTWLCQVIDVVNKL
jgi:hypothetical protein